ncbi:hypothetical protein ACFUKV_28295 [Streptomyces paradoxus]|uniref:hypothetical protein n=1 Tax=Streptomyces paradoxus TaxID=66375 RepID=UPI00362910DD
MRHCRYRGQPKAHLQHVLTAIAVKHRTPSAASQRPRKPLRRDADRFPGLSREPRRACVALRLTPHGEKRFDANLSNSIAVHAD